MRTAKGKDNFSKQQFKALQAKLAESLKGMDTIGTLNHSKKQITGLFLMDNLSFQRIQELQNRGQDPDSPENTINFSDLQIETVQNKQIEEKMQ